MIKFVMLFALSLTMISCCGCKMSGSKQKKMLTTTQWTLQGQDSQEESYTLNFDSAKGEIFGIGACNRYFGGYKMEGGNKIDLEPKGMTRMACHNDNGEQKFVDMLDSVDEFFFEGGKLLLFDDGALVATFISTVAK